MFSLGVVIKVAIIDADDGLPDFLLRRRCLTLLFDRSLEVGGLVLEQQSASLLFLDHCLAKAEL